MGREISVLESDADKCQQVGVWGQKVKGPQQLRVGLETQV